MKYLLTVKIISLSKFLFLLILFLFQYNKPRAQLSNNQDLPDCISSPIKEDVKEDNNNHHNGLKGGRPSQSMNSHLASATRIINHHLFGTISDSRQNTGN